MRLGPVKRKVVDNEKGVQISPSLPATINDLDVVLDNFPYALVCRCSRQNPLLYFGARRRGRDTNLDVKFRLAEMVRNNLKAKEVSEKFRGECALLT